MHLRLGGVHFLLLNYRSLLLLCSTSLGCPLGSGIGLLVWFRFLFTHVEVERVGLRSDLLIDLWSGEIVIRYVIFVVVVKSDGLGADEGPTDGENL